MTCTLHVSWDDRLVGYDFGPSHPMAPVRLKLTIELARAFGLFHLDGVRSRSRPRPPAPSLSSTTSPPTSTWCGSPAAADCWAQASRT